MDSSYTLQEILNQPISFKQTFNMMENYSVKNNEMHEQYLFTGCGTSYYLAIAASRFFQEATNIPSSAVPASELFINPDQVFSSQVQYKVVAISRSGTTSEIVKAVKTIQGKQNISVLAVTCNGNTEMAKLADEVIALDHISEKSVVMTQSFTNMFYALQLYAVKFSNDKKINQLRELPDMMEKVIQSVDVMKEFGENHAFQRVIFLGTGIFFGLAEEACLKLKEMTQTECEAYSTLEFRHGPISIVDSQTLVILLTSEKTKEMDESLIHDVKEFGAYTVAVGSDKPMHVADKTVNTTADLGDSISAVLVMPFLQMLAFYRAVSLNLYPDKPRNLNQVVDIVLPN
jgi:glucosamine--fructose-6-phosphate aminotransferase (isomerizing)